MSLYFQGEGLPKDYAETLKWWRKAAEFGDAYAQNNLGLLHASGQGAPHDIVQAQKWFNLAAAKGNREAAKNRDRATSKMTPDQIAEAQQLTSEWKPKK